MKRLYFIKFFIIFFFDIFFPREKKESKLQQKLEWNIDLLIYLSDIFRLNIPQLNLVHFFSILILKLCLVINELSFFICNYSWNFQ